MTTSRDTGTQHKLRMPPELKEKLFSSAKEMNRSLNAEIVARLEESFEPELKVSETLEFQLMTLLDLAPDCPEGGRGEEKPRRPDQDRQPVEFEQLRHAEWRADQEGGRAAWRLTRSGGQAVAKITGPDLNATRWPRGHLNAQGASRRPR